MKPDTLQQQVWMLVSAPLAGSRIQEGSEYFGEVVPKDRLFLAVFLEDWCPTPVFR